LRILQITPGTVNKAPHDTCEETSLMTDVQSVYQRGLGGPPMGPNLRGNKQVAIIGAGASGLCSAKYLLQAGFDVTLFEIGSQIGGM
jgi:NADPH-dependent glutamate synthase beta subunit-like oxidoreductase